MDIAGVDRALGDAHRVFVDSSTCIGYHSTTEVVHPVARHVFERIASSSDPLTGYLSVVSVSEMLVRPIRGGNRDLMLVHTFLRTFPNLHVINVDLEIALQAANVRALTRLPMPDALLIGTAMLAGCEAIVTNDERWARRLGPLYPQFAWVYVGS